MKKISLVLLMLVVVLSAFAEKTVVISTGEYAPFAGKNLKNHGANLHKITEAFAREGYKVEYRFYPWKRAYEEMKAGKVDASAFWFPSSERKKAALFSEPFAKEKTVFFHKKGKKIDWDKLEDLKSYRIGVTRGYTYTEELWDLGDRGGLNLDLANDDISNFKKLIHDRIDIFPGGLVVSMNTLRTKFAEGIADQVTYATKPLSEAGIYLLFSKKKSNAAELVKVFNSGLKKIKEDGTFDKIEDNLIEGKYTE